MSLDEMIEFVSGLRPHLASWRPLVPERKMTAIDERLFMVAEALKAAKAMRAAVKYVTMTEFEGNVYLSAKINQTEMGLAVREFDQATGCWEKPDGGHG